jgi:nucleoside-diphosphate-sugar epimerase
MTKFLITGHKSGLGRSLYEYFGGIGLARNKTADKFEHIRREGVDVIIHCASQPPRTVTLSSLYPFMDDNVLLTERISRLRHKKFVFISSVDVYPDTRGPHNEDEDISLASITNFYAAAKLMSESIVMKTCPNYLIFRCAALLGTYSRQNSLIKIAEEENPVVTLAASSVMNYVRHSQVADFIKYAVENNLKGIYNAVSSENIILSRVADLLKKKVRFGSHQYRVGDISNQKISSVFPSFKKTSEDIVRQFIKEDLPRRKI